VKERRLRAQQPATRGELREQQDGQRCARRSAGHHHQRDEQDVAGDERKQRLHQRQLHAVLLQPAERCEPKYEIKRRCRQERIGRVDVHRAQVEQQRKSKQQCAADGAEQSDDPQDPSRRAGDQLRQWLRRRRGSGGQRFSSYSGHG